MSNKTQATLSQQPTISISNGNETQATFNWQSSLSETFNDLSRHVIDDLPKIIGAILLLLVGWGIAHLATFAWNKFMKAFDSIFSRAFKGHHAKESQLKKTVTLAMGRIVYWSVIFFFAAASANLLGINIFTGWIEVMVSFLPRILTGLLIMLAGYIIGNVVQSLILNTKLKIRKTQTTLLAKIAQVSILTCALLIGIEHAGLNMHFLTELFTVVIAILLAGACLAFGLGATGMVANTIGAQYTRRNCQVGEIIKLAGLEGEILEIRQTCIILDTAEGKAIIPAKLFHEQVSIVRTASDLSATQPNAPTNATKEGSNE